MFSFSVPVSSKHLFPHPTAHASSRSNHFSQRFVEIICTELCSNHSHSRFVEIICGICSNHSHSRFVEIICTELCSNPFAQRILHFSVPILHPINRYPMPFRTLSLSQKDFNTACKVTAFFSNMQIRRKRRGICYTIRNILDHLDILEHLESLDHLDLLEHLEPLASYNIRKFVCFAKWYIPQSSNKCVNSAWQTEQDSLFSFFL